MGGVSQWSLVDASAHNCESCCDSHTRRGCLPYWWGELYSDICPFRHDVWQAAGFSSRGPIIVPSPLAICPSNHLVLYQDFTEDELAQLADYINTPEYQHAAETETSYYLKYLLQQELGATREKSTVDLVDTAGTLIEATWEAQNFVSQAFIDGAAAEEQQQYQKRFARYAAASIDATEKALAEVSPPNEPLFQQQMSLLLIAADFERRLGRFADAQNSIEALLNISEDGWISESYVGIAKQQLDWIKQHNTEPQVIAPFE